MAISTSFPYTLQNGTTADATQVMADFLQLQNDVNANAAHNGANSDITSLLGLTTPIPLGGGGTGVAAVSNSGLLTALGAAQLAVANAFSGLNDFTGGSLKLPTQPGTDNSTFGASTAFVQTAITAAKAARSIKLVATTVSGTYTPNPGFIAGIYFILGGGGAGGGSVSTSTTSAAVGGGGGAGGLCISVLTAAQIGANQSLVVGAAGVQQNGAAGGNGGTSSLGGLISATGGTGGAAASTNGNSTMQQGLGGNCGAGSGNGLAIYGQSGGVGQCYISSVGLANCVGGIGGGGLFSGAQQAVIAVNNNAYPGISASGIGGGGNGAAAGMSQAGQYGGAGCTGGLVVFEFCSQ